jgi:hypothetical protein
MMQRLTCFNIVLLTAILVMVPGCASLKSKKATVFRVHIEASGTYTPDSILTAEIGKNHLFALTVEKIPILDEGHIARAMVTKAKENVFLVVEFDRHGTAVLEQYTTIGRGLHMAIYAQFGTNLWIAAPEITRTIKDGVLRFTPDATQSEAERIVEGLNNVAAKIQKDNW